MLGKRREMLTTLVGQAQQGESMTQIANLILPIRSRPRTLPKVETITGHPLTNHRRQKTKRVGIRVHHQRVSITRIRGKMIKTETVEAIGNRLPSSRTNRRDSRKVGALASKTLLTHREKWFRRWTRAHSQTKKLRRRQMISRTKGKCSRSADRRHQSKTRHLRARNLRSLGKKPSLQASNRLPPHQDTQPLL